MTSRTAKQMIEHTKRKHVKNKIAHDKIFDQKRCPRQNNPLTYEVIEQQTTNKHLCNDQT